MAGQTVAVTGTTSTLAMISCCAHDLANIVPILGMAGALSTIVQWKFDIAMNTHSVELDHDMTKSVVLVDDQSKKHKPINWEGPVGGHHREGALTFNLITPTPKAVALKISDIGGIVRAFAWQLK